MGAAKSSSRVTIDAFGNVLRRSSVVLEHLRLRRKTFTVLSSEIDVRSATRATPATTDRYALLIKNVDRLDAARCYITG
jgi:hypothetical protein